MDGGKGIPRLAKLIHLANLRLGSALLANDEVDFQAACKKIANSMRIYWPVNPKNLV
jgi:hypothetical protein